MKKFQNKVKRWILKCFGKKPSKNITERNFRFLEEALELVQANGCTKEEAIHLVNYVYNREIGEVNQEVGGVMVTLAALCNVNGINMQEEAFKEIKRCNKNIDRIREKQAKNAKFFDIVTYTGDGTSNRTLNHGE